MESPPYFPQANGIAERAVRTVKEALVTWKENVYHNDFNTFLQRILFHHRVSSFSRGKSPAEIVFGRQLRVPIVSRFQQGERVWYKPCKEASPRSAVYLMAKGQNTSWLLDKRELRLASNNQVSSDAESDMENRAAAGAEGGVNPSTASSARETQEPAAFDRVLDGSAVTSPMAAVEEPRRSTRSRQEPHRWGYDREFQPVDT